MPHEIPYPSQPNPIDILVGARVKSRRRELGMSQTKLAQAIGVTFQQVQKYESGANRISSSRLQQIAKVLGVPISSFFPDAQSKVIPETHVERVSLGDIQVFLATDEAARLMRALSQIKNNQLRSSICRLVTELGQYRA
jgi:transcriptional regulator with XRE-family HTH domain